MKYLILDHLEATAARLPQKTAFADEGSAVTFEELIRLSRAVGSALLSRVAPRTTVGFYMDKSVQTVAGFFGAVYAG
ncbi:MAG: AMP-binding protein, partial [Candidatus Ventricola sp.]